MPNLVEIPGIGEVEFPDGMTPDDIAAAIEQMQQGQAPAADAAAVPQASFGDGLARGFADRVLNNAVNLPAVASELMNILPGRLTRQVQGRDTLAAPRTSPATVRAAMGSLPAAVRAANPGTFGLLAAQNKAAGAPTLGEEFRDRQVAEAADAARIAEQQPTATTVGKVGADALTLALARTPLAVMRGARPALQAPAATTSVAPQSFKNLALRVRDHAAMKALVRGAGRAGEAGVEGALIAALESSDPVDKLFTSAGAAAGQAAGSAARTMLSQAKRHPYVTLMLGYIFADRLAQNVIPGGGAPSIFEATDRAFDHATVALLAGLGASMAGAGRGAQRHQAALYAAFADARRAIPRGAVISGIDAARQAGGADFLRGLLGIAQSPDSFDAAEVEQVETAIKKGTLGETMTSLLADDGFRTRLDAAFRTDVAAAAWSELRDAFDRDVMVHKPVRARAAVEAAAAHVPQAVGRQLMAAKGPRAALRVAFGRPDNATAILEGVSEKERQVLLEANLDRLITAAVVEPRRAGGRMDMSMVGIDAGALRRLWHEQPEVVRNAYAAHTREAVDEFVSLIGGLQRPIYETPSVLARALMNENSVLTTRLLGTEEVAP